VIPSWSEEERGTEPVRMMVRQARVRRVKERARER
jgi:hypothetical protein